MLTKRALLSLRLNYRFKGEVKLRCEIREWVPVREPWSVLSLSYAIFVEQESRP
jgi:hypothetical protein